MTTRFIDVLTEDQNMSFDQRAEFAMSALADRIAQSALLPMRGAEWRFLKPEHVLLGVGNYSIYDLKLLDTLDRMIASGTHPDVEVVVFDASYSMNQEDFEGLIPGLGTVFHTPILGLWQGGELVHRASGAQAREFLLERYQLQME